MFRMSKRTSLLMACSICSPLLADITHNEWSSADDFYFHVNYMPDLDQARLTLDGNGSLYCVPTATMNMFSYIAEWGWPTLDPGPGVWQGDVDYWDMTELLEDLGQSMNTDNGTSNGGWNTGSQEWLEGYPLVRTLYAKTDDWCPKLSDCALYAGYGALVSFAYGRFNFNPDTQPVVGSYSSGHAVTIMHMRAVDGDLELGVRNPSGGGNLVTEAPWAQTVYDSVENKFVWQDWDGDSLFHPLEVTVINYDPDGDLIKIMDRAYTIMPNIGYDFSSVQINVHPFGGGLQVPTIPSHAPMATFGFGAVAPHPDLHAYISLQVNPNDPARLVTHNRLTGGTALLGTFSNATDFIVGRHREMFILSGNIITRTTLDATVIDTYTLTHPGQAIVYRDATDELIVVSTAARKMTILPRTFGTSDVYELPSLIPASNAPSVAVRESDGAIAILTPENNQTVYGLRTTSSGGLLPVEMLHTAASSQSVSFNDNDNLLVAAIIPGVTEYRPTGICWWCWSAVLDGWFDDFEPSGTFRVWRSRSNHDAVFNLDHDIMISSSEFAPLGISIPDCLGDIDFDSEVGFSDLLLLLASWGACDGCPADFSHSGDVGFTDLIDLLANWGPCR